MEMVIQIAGWFGTSLIVLAYILDSYKKIDSGGILYHVLNFFGAIGVGVNVFYQRAWPALALQVVWGIIAVVSLSKRTK